MTTDKEWRQALIRVPPIPHKEVETDEQFLGQCAEWIVDVVRLSSIDGDRVLVDKKPEVVEDAVLKILQVIYESTKEAYARKD